MGVPEATVAHDGDEGDEEMGGGADRKERVREQLLCLVTHIESLQALVALMQLARPFVRSASAGDTLGGLLATYYWCTVVL